MPSSVFLQSVIHAHPVSEFPEVFVTSMDHFPLPSLLLADQLSDTLEWDPVSLSLVRTMHSKVMNLGHGNKKSKVYLLLFINGNYNAAILFGPVSYSYFSRFILMDNKHWRSFTRIYQILR